MRSQFRPAAWSGSGTVRRTRFPICVRGWLPAANGPPDWLPSAAGMTAGIVARVKARMAFTASSPVSFSCSPREQPASLCSALSMDASAAKMDFRRVVKLANLLNLLRRLR